MEQGLKAERKSDRNICRYKTNSSLHLWNQVNIPFMFGLELSDNKKP